MNFSAPPGADDIEVMVRAVLESLPDELAEKCENVALRIDEFPDDAIQQDLDIEDPFELLALFRSGSQIAPGVTKKTANDDDSFLVFRRPVLDAWCETCDDLMDLLRQVVIEEIGRNFDFTEAEIEEMATRY